MQNTLRLHAFLTGVTFALATFASAQTPTSTPAPGVMSPAPPAAPPEPHFSRPAELDYAKILPAPPAGDSLAAQAELEVVLQVQAARTEEQVAWAKFVERDSAFKHAAIVGAWFTAENLPRTAAFFKELDDDLRAIDRAAKKPFLRPRPGSIDPAVQPCVSLPTSTSYPSGSAIQAYVLAELLTDLFPAKRAELDARAHRAAWGRIIGGVHFPTDIMAGQRLAPWFVAECRKSPAFREGLEGARQEIAAFAAKAGR